MAKKRKRKQPRTSQGKRLKKGQSRRTTSMLWIGGLVLAGVIVFFFVGDPLSFFSGETKKGKSFYVRGGETRPVLEPFQFIGRTRKAYAAAKKYPEVMDEVFCYCNCDQSPFKHKSLLSCFVDKHAAG
jgi:hypothetical protein